MNLKEIEERVGREVIALDPVSGLAYYRIQQGPAYCQAIADSAALLAEVKRLKALCGRAAYYIPRAEPDCGDANCPDCAFSRLGDELKEAASESA